jgi:ribonuclease HI
MTIPFSQSLVPHLNWWLNPVNILKGRSVTPIECSITVTTDASLKLWGGHLGNQIVQGQWTETEKLQHINCLEMEAVHRTIKHFLPYLGNKHVLIRSDNTTVVQYINKQGGTKSLILNQKTWDLWQMLLQNKTIVRAAHVTGKLNVLADQLSRTVIKQTEWTLKQSILNAIFLKLGHPSIDLFASVHNHKLPVFCSWSQCPQAYAIDALTISWENIFAYAFPPIALIPRLLQHMTMYNCRILLIAPCWPRRPWYPQLLQYLVAYPIKLPLQKDLLSQPNTKILHQNPKMLSLTAWLLSTNPLEQRDFQRKLENFSQPHGELVLDKTTHVNSENLVAGVIKGKLIPIMQL